MPPALDTIMSMVMFAHVVEAKSFSAAAAIVGVSKSVVSKRISALEAELQTRLLHRTTRRLSLTPEGVRFYERCAAMVRLADDALALAEREGDAPRGTLRVSCPLTFSDLYLAGFVTEFVRRYPGVRVELSVGNQMVDLISERVDVAIRIAPELQSSSLVARRLTTVPKLICASPGYLRARGAPRTPDDLRAHDCLRFSHLPVDVEWRLYKGNKAFVAMASGPITADNSEALRRSALAGAGLVVLPLFYVAKDLASGGLVTVLDDYRLDDLGIFAVYSKGALVGPKVRAFVDFLVTCLRPPPWEERGPSR